MILDLRFFGFVTKKKMQHPKLDSLALRQYWRETDENKPQVALSPISFI